MGKTGEQLVVVALAIISVATLAVIVSNNANTTGVLSAFGNAFSGALGAALKPVSGTGGL